MDLFDMVNEEFGQPESKYGTPKKTRMGRRQFTGDADAGGLGQHMETPQDRYRAARRRARGKARSFTDPSHRRARGVKKVTAGTDYKELFGPSVKNILESERRSAAHRKYRARQSTAREAWMDLPAYRKHLRRRGVKTKGTGEGPSRGRGGPESVERGESGDPKARGGSASFRRAGGSAKASRAIRNESKGKAESTAKKSKAKVYDSITDALSKGYLGQIFSTKASKRLYVITKRKWGSDPEQEVSGRVAKGFSPGTIPSSFSDVKGYAVRTMARHGKQTAKKYQGSKYWKSKKGKD